MHLFARMTIGLIEVVGGILGVAMIIAEVWSDHTIGIVSALFGGLYVVTIIAGAALLRGQRFGGVLSLLVQVAQLPRMATAGCAYQFAAGAGLWAMFGSSGAGMSWAIGSVHQWSTTAAAGAYPFGVNLIAAVAVALLLAVPSPKIKRQHNKRRPLAFA